MENVKAIIFDWDGTIVDSMPTHIEAYLKALAKFGIKANAQDILDLVGTPTELLAEEVANKYGVKTKGKEIAKEKIKNYIEFSKSKNLIFDGALEILLALKPHYKLALLSGSTRKQLDNYKEILELFEITVAGKEASKPKPNPDALWDIADKLDLVPSECAYIGDFWQDMMAAEKAGMWAIGIRNRYVSDKELTDAGADIIINNLNELLTTGLL
ncbi:MAG: HAD family hydrolase [Candidatus Diapherotrites archaeon]